MVRRVRRRCTRGGESARARILRARVASGMSDARRRARARARDGRAFSFVTDAAQSGASAREFARAMTHTSRALTIVGTVADVRPLASRLVAALVASASAEGEAEDEGDARAEALLSLMTHDLEDVRATAYATLAASCAVDVLKHPLILSEIIVGGAHHVSTVRDAATCLQTLCARSSGDAAVAAHLSMHAAWLDAMSDDVDLGDAAMRARAFVAEANVGGRLGRLSTALRGLFHQDEKTRVRCATDLAHDIGQGVTSAADVLLRSTNDPFDDVLLEDDAYVRNRDDVDDSPRVDAFRESLRSRTFDDVRASIRAFIDHDDESETKQSVEELVAELEITVRDERLAAALADPRTLDAPFEWRSNKDLTSPSSPARFKSSPRRPARVDSCATP